jgi:glycosyltransferase involved in cell wall biosynthesis
VNREDYSVSVIIPVYNEERTVGDVITRTRNTLEKFKIPYEVLVIDDGSVDRSLEISKTKEANVLGGTHQGKGYAIRSGLKRAKGNIVVTLDADGSHKPEEIPLVLQCIIENKADFAIGSRFFSAEVNKAKIPGVNRLGNRIFNSLMALLTSMKISDSQSGFRAIKSAVIKEMKLNSRGYELESEMLVKAFKMGVRVVEVPISFEQRTVGKSRLDPIKDGIRILNSIITSYLF